MSALGDFFGGLGNAAGTFGKGVGQILTGDWGGAVQTASQNPYSKPAAAPKQPGNSPAPSYTPPAYTPSSDYAAQAAALDRQTQAIYAQIAAQPKLIYRDVNAAWQNAQNRAASTVNPVYQDNLNRILQNAQNMITQQTAQTTADKTASDINLQQTQQDIGTQQERTGEDLASAIAQSKNNEANWQTQEGMQADQSETAARTALGDQGQEGRGAQALETNQIVRNQNSSEQTQQFTNERATKELLANRTFEDLSTKGNRAVELNTTEKSNLDRKLNDFITNQNLDTEAKKAQNESERLSALYDATQNAYKTDTASWLASLVNGGARSQDIALTSQVYG